MALREKVQKIVIEMAEGKNLDGIKDIFFRYVLDELKKPDGYFDAAWNKMLQQGKEGIIKSAVYEVIKNMPEEDRIKLLGGKDVDNRRPQDSVLDDKETDQERADSEPGKMEGTKGGVERSDSYQPD